MLQARRMDGDYGDYVEISAAEAGDSLEKARRFIVEADRVRSAFES